MAIGANAPGDAALDRAVELERLILAATCRATGIASKTASARAVLGIDGDEIGFRQIGIAVGKIGAGVVDIVRHPPEGCWPIQLNVTALECRFFSRILSPSLGTSAQ